MWVVALISTIVPWIPLPTRSWQVQVPVIALQVLLVALIMRESKGRPSHS